MRGIQPSSLFKPLDAADKPRHVGGTEAVAQLSTRPSLEDAKALWSVLSVEVKAKTVDEPRTMIIGKIRNKFYSCIYTVRGDVTRLISARRSRESEEEIYYDSFEE
ncbi:MAG: BrnT family toxin [Legionella sp.]|nr:BrnT family toxin [Legionella sp.]